MLARLSGKTVGIVYGPSSVEDRTYSDALPREEWSAHQIVAALHGVGVAARVVDPTSEAFVRDLESCDVIFVNSHGHFGEDGRLQGVLEHLELPYTFSGVLTQAVGLDKLVTKAVFEHVDVSTPRSTRARPVDQSIEDSPFGYPVMLKAPDGGSSLGLELVHDRGQLESARASIAAQRFATIFLEEYVPGRSVTVSVLETEGRLQPLPPIEVETDAAYYDAACKLGAGGEARSSVPDDLPDEIIERLRSDAVRVGEFLHARGAFRVDFVVAPNGDSFALEINTVPGMQQSSNLPEAARHAGLEYVDLVLTLLSAALEAKPDRAGRGSP
ncbi:D-alanine--D-alanine ligase family protein [Frigoribacterium salinisoli]